MGGQKNPEGEQYRDEQRSSAATMDILVDMGFIAVSVPAPIESLFLNSPSRRKALCGLQPHLRSLLIKSGNY